MCLRVYLLLYTCKVHYQTCSTLAYLFTSYKLYTYILFKTCGTLALCYFLILAGDVCCCLQTYVLKSVFVAVHM